MDVHPTAAVLLQSLLFLLQPLKIPPARLPAPSSCGRLCCRASRTAPPYSIASQAIPLLTHTSCYFLATTAGPVNPRTPHCVGNHFRVFPGSVSFPSQASPSSTALVFSARRGQRGQRTTSIGHGLYVERLTAGSTATHKEMPPCYAQNNDSST